MRLRSFVTATALGTALLHMPIASQAWAVSILDFGAVGANGISGSNPGESGTAGQPGGSLNATLGPNQDSDNFADEIGGFGGKGGDGVVGDASVNGGNAGRGG